MYDNLKKIDKNYEWLKKEVGKFGFLPEQALIVIQNGDKRPCRKVYLQTNDGRCCEEALNLG